MSAIINKKITAVAAFLLLILSLSGCSVKSADDLCALPRHPDSGSELQTAIDAVMTKDFHYCAPVSGENRQSVQLEDLDGDGETEAVVFTKTDGEDPLRAFVFDLVDGRYQNVAVLAGAGSDFSTVEYLEIDGSPGLEMILGRQLNGQLLMSFDVYQMRDGQMQPLLAAACSEYASADLDSDGCTDLLLFRPDGTQNGIAEFYRNQDGKLCKESEAPMSGEIREIRRVVSGNLTWDTPAVFVAASCTDEKTLTDVFAFRNGQFSNVTLSDSGRSDPTLHSLGMYAADIDSDGVIELPEQVTLPVSDASGEVFSLFKWYNLDLNGNRTDKITTCHRFSSGWYLILLEQWNDQITIRRTADADGAQGLEFLQWRGMEEPVPIFSVFAFSGEDRNVRGTSDGRFILAEKGGMTYAAKPGTSIWTEDLTQEQMKQMFNFIHIDWNSGET